MELPYLKLIYPLADRNVEIDLYPDTCAYLISNYINKPFSTSISSFLLTKNINHSMYIIEENGERKLNFITEFEDDEEFYFIILEKEKADKLFELLIEYAWFYINTLLKDDRYDLIAKNLLFKNPDENEVEIID